MTEARQGQPTSEGTPAPELLPCPFCGNAPTVERWPARAFDAEPERLMVTCENEGDDANPRCPLEGSFMELEAWNRRALPALAPAAPPSDSRETLERAAQVCERYAARLVELKAIAPREFEALDRASITAHECASRIRALPAVPSDDTERLDWLEGKHEDGRHPHTIRSIVEPIEDEIHARFAFSVDWCGEHETLREAIDAARSTPASTPSEEHKI